MVVINESDYLAHYGILRKSGRYPWGSGGPETNTGTRSFTDMIDNLRNQGLSETEIATGMGVKTSELRAAVSIASNEQKQLRIDEAQRYKDKGYSNVEVGKKMGLNESTVRGLLAPGAKDKADVLMATANMLRNEIDQKKYVDVGAGAHFGLNVADTKLKTAVALLREEGYTYHYVKVLQLGTGHETTMKVMAGPDVTGKEMYHNKDNIQQLGSHTTDGGRTYTGVYPPLSISSSRVGVLYAEQGGAKADGVIYVRPGVSDVSLGGKNYAQVRIMVDGTHYLKGMAMYKDGLPKGVDLQFNTNKSDTGNKLDSMKDIKSDPENPFGAIVRQRTAVDANGKTFVTSVMNRVGAKEGAGEEGGWETWSKRLSSQVLSKQAPGLAKQQLGLAYDRKKQELDEINALTNPTVRKKLLQTFADGADSSAVHLHAAALPGQATHVILPVNSLKDTEVFAPKYNNGDRVALIRYPHAGTFEIPELTVNNRHPDAIKLLGKNPQDAIGINHKVAERLSGADFDGDTVLVIPNRSGKIKTTAALKGLQDFDPKREYPPYDGMKTMDGGTYNAKTNKTEFAEGSRASGRTKQKEMGDVSNLITDMTIAGAGTADLARAVRHSMVVIDAEKHNLNYKESFRQNGISQLKERYQGKKNAGASTLISKATSPLPVNERKQGYKIDPDTGKKIYTETGRSYTNAKGKLVISETKSTKLGEADDAFSLVSDGNTMIERVYAEHSNKLKALGNEARKTLVTLDAIAYSPSAKQTYNKEVADLNAKLNLALRNAPLERQSQVIANATYRTKKAANPDMDKDEQKKVKGLALVAARARTGAGKNRIDITQEEWNAIQAGAITKSKLAKILDNSDLDRIKELATPRSQLLMTSTKTQQAKNMFANGYTQAEVAEALGVSVTTLGNSLKG